MRWKLLKQIVWYALAVLGLVVLLQIPAFVILRAIRDAQGAPPPTMPVPDRQAVAD